MTPLTKSSLLILAIAGCFTGRTEAQTWNTASDGYFDDSANWSPAAVPGSGNTATFNNAAADLTVTLRADQALSNITQTAGDVEFDLDGYRFTLSTLTLHATGGNGTTTFRDGSLQMGGNIAVGQTESGSRSVVFSNVTVTQSSANATNLRVGQTAGHQGANVTISDGSNFSIYGIHVGNGNLSTGNRLTLTGAATTVDARFLQVGVSTVNSTSVDNHFTMTGGTLNLSNADGFNTQYFLVMGTGNSATLSGGNLNVTNTAGSAYIRAQAGGTFTVNGATVRANRVWRGATDADIIFDSGVIATEQTTYSAHTLTVGDGGSEAATYRLLDAMPGVSGSGIHTAGLFDFRSNGILEGNGQMVGDVRSEGVIDAGLEGDIGRLEITGDLTLESTSIVRFTLAGLSDYDQIIVGDALAFDGTLELTLDGFTVSLDDSFQLFTAGSFSGGFSSLDFSNAQLAPGLHWSFDADTGLLQAIPEAHTIAFLAAGSIVFFLHRRRRPQTV